MKCWSKFELYNGKFIIVWSCSTPFVCTKSFIQTKNILIFNYQQSKNTILIFVAFTLTFPISFEILLRFIPSIFESLVIKYLEMEKSSNLKFWIWSLRVSGELFFSFDYCLSFALCYLYTPGGTRENIRL